MFTGIVTDLGKVLEIADEGERRLAIGTAYDAEAIALGASIACNGVCLTVIERGPGRFAADVSAETLALTTIGAWKPGTPVNLERSLRAGDELGGHIMLGHVDGLARVISIVPENDSLRFTFEAPEALAHFVARKGSIAIDGVSLTVNEVDGRRFGVNIIPHTSAVTSLGTIRPGGFVNMEIDPLARYVARLLERG